MKKPKANTSEIMEVVAKKLFGITTVPKKEQEKMCYRAARAAQQYHTTKIKTLLAPIQKHLSVRSDTTSLNLLVYLNEELKRLEGE